LEIKTNREGSRPVQRGQVLAVDHLVVLAADREQTLDDGCIVRPAGKAGVGKDRHRLVDQHREAEGTGQCRQRGIGHVARPDKRLEHPRDRAATRPFKANTVQWKMGKM
jgi:hypothetical protein